MPILMTFLPILLFISLYVGSGVYYTILEVPNAFYQLPPTVAILPAIVLGFLLKKGDLKQRRKAFIKGAAHKDIITMCLIFLLAGAFSSVTSSIGSTHTIVNLFLSFVPSHFLLVGLFVTAAFISTAIGTSMGTIATMAPIAAALSSEGAFGAALGMGTIIGGAMFGDNLSLISDTTIASVFSQEANLKDKFWLNAKLAAAASIITIIITFFAHDATHAFEAQDFQLILALPYFILIALAIMGVNVFFVLIFSLVAAYLIGFFVSGYTIPSFGTDIVSGFRAMSEIVILSLLVGGMSGLVSEGSKKLALQLSDYAHQKQNTRLARFILAKIVSIFDIFLANNTIAIIFTGEIAREIAKKNHIKPHESATIIDIASCVFQGIIPYGAQILLASSIAGISPVTICPYVFYCYVLAFVLITYIFFTPTSKSSYQAKETV